MFDENKIFGNRKTEPKPTQKKIKNKRYRQFLDTGIIDTLEESDILKVIDSLTTIHKPEASALISLLYWTGARPLEILDLKAKDITREKRYIKVQLRASKGGLPRRVEIPFKFKSVKIVWEFASQLMPERFMFFNYRSYYEYKRLVKGKIKTRRLYTQKLYFNLKKWFSVLGEGKIPPYFLRHNRFSKLAQNGATLQEIRMIKGSKTYASVMPYVHMSAEIARKTAKKMT